MQMRFARKWGEPRTTDQGSWEPGKQLGSPWKIRKQLSERAKQMKDICIYSRPETDLRQAGEIKSFLKDILYNLALKTEQAKSESWRQDVCLAGPGKKPVEGAASPWRANSRCFTHVPSGLKKSVSERKEEAFSVVLCPGTFACDF